MDTFVEVTPEQRLWVRAMGPEDAPALLLIMGANACGLTWPRALVTALAARHRIVLYDHRDTGRSTWGFEQHPYAIADLAGDAVAILDALGIERAHVVGMSMGGVLVQLLALDHPDRLHTATVLCTAALEGGPDRPALLPDPDPRLLALWEHLGDARDREAELDWRVAHWRVLNGDVVPFDEAAFRAVEAACIDHTGTQRNPAAHARADQGGLERGDEMGQVRVPLLVIEAPQDPISPPPHAPYLAGLVPGSTLVTVPGMGHALAPAILIPLSDAVLTHTLPPEPTPSTPSA